MSSVVGNSVVNLEWVSDDNVVRRLSASRKWFTVYTGEAEEVGRGLGLAASKKNPPALKQPTTEADPEPKSEPNQKPNLTRDKEGLDLESASANSLYRDAQGALRMGMCSRKLSGFRLDRELRNLRS